MRRMMLVALALNLGCDCSAETEATNTAAPVVEAEPAAEESTPETPAEVAPQPSPSRTDDAIGIRVSPWAIDEAAQGRNAAALRVHRREAFDDAAQQWRALVDEVPDYDAARFNLACALVRTSALEEARSELRIVLSHNLPRYEALLAEDEDLAPLREDDDLAQHIQSLRERYQSAGSEGVPAVFRRRIQGEYDEEADEQARSRGDVVAGVYQHTTRRFVPLIKAQRYVDESEYYGTYLDVLASADATSFLLVRTHFISAHGYAPPHVTFLRPFGESIEEHQVRDPDYGQILAFEACLSGGGFRFRAQNPDGWFPERHFPR
ncbi:MAG: hypothetical protein AB8H86_33285 [Polyangiales bacterium]